MSLKLLETMNHAVDEDNDMDDATIFASVWEPHVSIVEYAKTVLINLKLDYRLLIVTFYYMARYTANKRLTYKDFKVRRLNVHRLFLTAAIVTHKLWVDDCHENRAIAALTNMKMQSVGRMEVEFLKTINWRTHLHRVPLYSELSGSVLFLFNISLDEHIKIEKPLVSKARTTRNRRKSI
jgi:mannose-6-phosphate isomerase-like protein (cupin superfamily)